MTVGELVVVLLTMPQDATVTSLDSYGSATKDLGPIEHSPHQPGGSFPCEPAGTVAIAGDF